MGITIYGSNFDYKVVTDADINKQKANDLKNKKILNYSLLVIQILLIISVSTTANVNTSANTNITTSANVTLIANERVDPNIHGKAIIFTICFSISLYFFKQNILDFIFSDSQHYTICARCQKKHLLHFDIYEYSEWICWDCVTEEDYEKNNIPKNHLICNNRKCKIKHCLKCEHTFTPKFQEGYFTIGSEEEDTKKHFCSGFKCAAFEVGTDDTTE